MQRTTLPDYLTRPDGTPSDKLTDLNEIYSLLSRLDSREKNMIEFLKDNEWESRGNEFSTFENEQSILLAIDRINAIAKEVLGDILIADEGNMKTIVDDYRDELEYILDAEKKHRKIASGKEYSGLPEGWDEFAVQINECQYLAIRAIESAINVREKIKTLSESFTVMPEMIIDSINEIALDTIGDVVIEPGSDPPIFEDEDKDAIRKLINAKDRS